MGPCTYILRTTDGAYTYVGFSTHFAHRLRQHNREICGGARFCTNMVARGHAWEPVVVVTGFATDRCARQFEAAQKPPLAAHRRGGTDPSLRRRIAAACAAEYPVGNLHARIATLVECLHLGRWTPHADPAPSSRGPLQCIWFGGTMPSPDFVQCMPSTVRHSSHRKLEGV